MGLSKRVNIEGEARSQDSKVVCSWNAPNKLARLILVDRVLLNDIALEVLQSAKPIQLTHVSIGFFFFFYGQPLFDEHVD